MIATPKPAPRRFHLRHRDAIVCHIGRTGCVLKPKPHRLATRTDRPRSHRPHVATGLHSADCRHPGILTLPAFKSHNPAWYCGLVHRTVYSPARRAGTCCGQKHSRASDQTLMQFRTSDKIST